MGGAYGGICVVVSFTLVARINSMRMLLGSADEVGMRTHIK